MDRIAFAICGLTFLATVLIIVFAIQGESSVWADWTNKALFAAAALAGLGALCVSAITAFVAMAFLRAVQEASGMAKDIKALDNRIGNLEDRQETSSDTDKIRENVKKGIVAKGKKS